MYSNVKKIVVTSMKTFDIISGNYQFSSVTVSCELVCIFYMDNTDTAGFFTFSRIVLDLVKDHLEKNVIQN